MNILKSKNRLPLKETEKPGVAYQDFSVFIIRRQSLQNKKLKLSDSL